jgi:hypothetical protein
VGGRLREPRPANKLIALNPRRSASGFLPQTLCLFRKAPVERFDLFETTPLLHGALLSVRGRRDRVMAFSSQIEARNRAVMTY